MCIYTNGIIYGIQIITYKDDTIHILFERTDTKIMKSEILYEAKMFYDRLDDKNNLFFRIYNECSSTCREGVFMLWSEISLEEFLEIFD